MQVDSTVGHPTWLRELSGGPEYRAITWPMMFTRGYTFHTYDHGKDRSTSNYGLCVKGSQSSTESTDEPDFYGILQRIIEVQYPGIYGLKTVIFKGNWYDTSERGTRRAVGGGIEINPDRTYSKNNEEPFILSTQADQVCFLPYPSTKRRREKWNAVVKIQPRGVVQTVDNDERNWNGPMQEENDESAGFPIQVENDVVHRLARDDDIEGSDSVNDTDLQINDPEADEEFETSSHEDDNTSTNPDSL